MNLINETKAWFHNLKGNQILRVHTSEDENETFFPNDFDEFTKTEIYSGASTPDDVWRITQIVGDKDLTIRYATISNNPAVLTYSDAWTNRLTLTYDLITNL